jgi:NADH-quinone oxidoreductase subunit C
MNNRQLKEELESAFKDIRVNMPEDNRLTVYAGKERIVDILRFLKGNGYDHLALISCVDRIEKGEFEMVYIIHSYLGENNEYTDKEKINIILKTRIPREDPQISTVISVFENSEPYERELHELFGIIFENHPRLTPLFLEREYEIPPFRKDFDTRKYVEEFFDKIPPVEE